MAHHCPTIVAKCYRLIVRWPLCPSSIAIHTQREIDRFRWGPTKQLPKQEIKVRAVVRKIYSFYVDPVHPSEMISRHLSNTLLNVVHCPVLECPPTFLFLLLLLFSKAGGGVIDLCGKFSKADQL